MRPEYFLPGSVLGKTPAWRIWSASFLVHAVLLFIIAFASSRPTVSEEPLKKETIVTELAPYKVIYPASSKLAGGGGGGGERMDTPASKGKLPKFSTKLRLTPPVAVLRNPNPKLPAEPTLIGPPEIELPSPNLPNYGDPLAALLTNSSGPGSGGGIGTGSGGGVGSGGGSGVGHGSGGGAGDGVYEVGGGVSAPECLYCPNPKFTDEAIKDRVSGVPLLSVVVKENGVILEGSVRMVNKVGYGLDEAAMEAVRGWRFKPGKKDGKPVRVRVYIEVKFRML